MSDIPTDYGDDSSDTPVIDGSGEDTTEVDGSGEDTTEVDGSADDSPVVDEKLGKNEDEQNTTEVYDSGERVSAPRRPQSTSGQNDAPSESAAVNVSSPPVEAASVSQAMISEHLPSSSQTDGSRGTLGISPDNQEKPSNLEGNLQTPEGNPFRGKIDGAASDDDHIVAARGVKETATNAAAGMMLGAAMLTPHAAATQENIEPPTQAEQAQVCEVESLSQTPTLKPDEKPVETTDKPLDTLEEVQETQNNFLDAAEALAQAGSKKPEDDEGNDTDEKKQKVRYMTDNIGEDSEVIDGDTSSSAIDGEAPPEVDGAAPEDEETLEDTSQQETDSIASFEQDPEQHVNAAVESLQEVEGIQSDAWQELEPGERLEALQEVENRMAELQGREPLTIRTEPMESGSFGYYDGQSITVNENDLAGTEMPVHEFVDTVVHEGRHAYQDHAISNPGTVDEGVASAWAENMKPGNYLTAEEYGQEAYANQPIEADAWNYGSSIAGSLYGNQESGE
jgi:hypothetical protein